MRKKGTRSKSVRREFRYSAEDLEPKDAAADDAFIDAFIERNREALNESLAAIEKSFERGEVHTLKEVMAEIAMQRKRRRAKRRRR